MASAETSVPSGEDNRIALGLDQQGRQCLEKGQFGQAVVFFEKALELNPELAAIHHNLGVTWFRLGRFADALTSFERTIELGRTTGLVYSHRAAARFALGDLPGSRADFEKSLQVAVPSERDEVDANFREFETRLKATAS